MKFEDPEDRLLDSLDAMFENEDYWCDKCIHFNPEDESCPAFPHGIPDEIFEGLVRHTKPYPGDHGIMFEPKEKQG